MYSKINRNFTHFKSFQNISILKLELFWTCFNTFPVEADSWRPSQQALVHEERKVEAHLQVEAVEFGKCPDRQVRLDPWGGQHLRQLSHADAGVRPQQESKGSRMSPPSFPGRNLDLKRLFIYKIKIVIHPETNLVSV